MIEIPCIVHGRVSDIDFGRAGRRHRRRVRRAVERRLRRRRRRGSGGRPRQRAARRDRAAFRGLTWLVGSCFFLDRGWLAGLPCCPTAGNAGAQSIPLPADQAAPACSPGQADRPQPLAQPATHCRRRPRLAAPPAQSIPSGSATRNGSTRPMAPSSAGSTSPRSTSPCRAPGTAIRRRRRWSPRYCRAASACRATRSRRRNGMRSPPSRACPKRSSSMRCCCSTAAYVKKDVNGAYALLEAAAEAGNRAGAVQFRAARRRPRARARPAWPRRSPTTSAPPRAGLADAQYAMSQVYANGVGGKKRDEAAGPALAGAGRAAGLRHRRSSISAPG